MPGVRFTVAWLIRSKMVHRNEEGLLILSKYSIRQHMGLFLPRELGNPRYASAFSINCDVCDHHLSSPFAQR